MAYELKPVAWALHMAPGASTGMHAVPRRPALEPWLWGWSRSGHARASTQSWYGRAQHAAWSCGDSMCYLQFKPWSRAGMCCWHPAGLNGSCMLPVAQLDTGHILHMAACQTSPAYWLWNHCSGPDLEGCSMQHTVCAGPPGHVQYLHQSFQHVHRTNFTCWSGSKV